MQKIIKEYSKTRSCYGIKIFWATYSNKNQLISLHKNQAVEPGIFCMVINQKYVFHLSGFWDSIVAGA